jgi:hypothetical protein
MTMYTYYSVLGTSYIPSAGVLLGGSQLLLGMWPALLPQVQPLWSGSLPGGPWISAICTYWLRWVHLMVPLSACLYLCWVENVKSCEMLQ